MKISLISRVLCGLTLLPFGAAIAQVPAIKVQPAVVIDQNASVDAVEIQLEVPSEDVDSSSESAESQIATPTHRQAKVFYPMVDGAKLQLRSFCVTDSGTVLAVCGGPLAQADAVSATGYLIAFQADGSQSVLAELPFAATAIAAAPDHTLYIAGDGQVAHLGNDGSTLKLTDAPNMGDKDKMMEEARKTAEARNKQYAEMFEDQIKMIQERITAIEEKDEADRSRAEKSRLKAYRSQLDAMETSIKSFSYSPEAVLAGGKRITAITANEKDVFVSCGSISGAGYAIWRTNRDLEEPVEVISAVSGCCGQMDVQCCDDGFMLAENTSFQVGRYDRDGKKLGSFGKGDRTSAAGFGSCCNPMNVYSAGANKILTAESSVGHIKCFDNDGQFVSYIGKAKIGGGCKHCSLGYDPNSDQYYMMYEDQNSICVLVNSKNLPDMTDEERALSEIRSKFQDRLLGTWELTPAKAAAKTDEAAESEDSFSEDLISISDNPLFFQKLTFGSDGSMEGQGGLYADFDGDWNWDVIEQKDNKVLKLSLAVDQVSTLNVTIDFQDPNVARFRFGSDYGMEGLDWVAAKRVADCEGKACDQGQCDEPQGAIDK